MSLLWKKRNLFLVSSEWIAGGIFISSENPESAKRKLLELLMRQDITYNHGLCLIDPHGDVIEAMLDYIPKERIEDVCIIDPTDIDFPASFNPLANVDPMFKFQLTQGLIEVFQKQFGANWTPRLGTRFSFYLSGIARLSARHDARNDFHADRQKLPTESGGIYYRRYGEKILRYRIRRLVGEI